LIGEIALRFLWALHQPVDALLQVKAFTQEEAEAFVLARGLQGDRATVSQLLRELEGVPLALDLAVKHIEQTNLSIAQYLVRYSRIKDQLLKVGESAAPDRVASELVAAGA
jgi:hypothetical protein